MPFSLGGIIIAIVLAVVLIFAFLMILDTLGVVKLHSVAGSATSPACRACMYPCEIIRAQLAESLRGGVLERFIYWLIHGITKCRWCKPVCGF